MDPQRFRPKHRQLHRETSRTGLPMRDFDLASSARAAVPVRHRVPVRHHVPAHVLDPVRYSVRDLGLVVMRTEFLGSAPAGEVSTKCDRPKRNTILKL